MKELNSIEEAPWKDPVFENEYLKVFLDAVPVNEGHKLYVPKQKSAKYIDKCFEYALSAGKEMVRTQKCDGFNIGMNWGIAAGQTLGWPHIHLIPRFHGDMDDPRGGVRHVIPERGNYKTSPYYYGPEYDHITGRTYK